MPYKVILADGTEIDNLEMNGTCFISEEEIDETIFDFNTSPVTIIDEEGNEEVHEHCFLNRVFKDQGKWWFSFRDIPQNELDRERNRADIEYIAMMTGVEI